MGSKKILLIVLTQSNTALFEKDLELLVIANVTVFPRPNLLFLHPYYACDTGLITTTSGPCLSKRVATEIRHWLALQTLYTAGKGQWFRRSVNQLQHRL